MIPFAKKRRLRWVHRGKWSRPVPIAEAHQNRVKLLETLLPYQTLQQQVAAGDRDVAAIRELSGGSSAKAGGAQAASKDRGQR